MAFLNRCCGCGVGAVIPRWQNISKARPAGDTGGTHYTATPYPRFDPSIYNTENPGAGCNTLPAGSCGNWLVGGDLNGLSAQEIEDTVDDIMACAGDDTTHAKIDHNCYFKNGDTVDMRQPKLFGGQWVLAKKFWHGTFPWNHSDGCGGNPADAPCQVKYLTVDYEISNDYKLYGEDSGQQPTVLNNHLQSTASGGFSVNSKSGILTNTLVTTEDIYSTGPAGLAQSKHCSGGAGWLKNLFLGSTQNPNSGMTTSVDSSCGDYHCNALPVVPGYGSDLAAMIAVFNALGGTQLPPVTDYNNYNQSGTYTSPAGFITSNITISWTRTDTTFTWNFYWEYTRNTQPETPGLNENEKEIYDFSGTATLSNPYTSADCYNDFKSALAAWDMSDINLASLRTDETLALAPLCVFDEFGPTSPIAGFKPVTMDDFSAGLDNDQNGNAPGTTSTSAGQNDANGLPPSSPNYSGGADYITTWHQRPWLDSANYIWKFPNGSYSMPTGFSSGATLVSPMRTGAIISHTQPGSDRHFWFNFEKFKRELDPTRGFYEWFNDTNGAFSESPLPPVTMRWMDKSEASYDGAAFRNGADAPPGNYPQAFWTERGGVIRGAKFVQASERWPSVNFGRPCGADKYAVDQPSVCCITGGDATSGFTVKKTGNAIAPLASGGLVVNDYIVVEADGIYKIAGITDNGTSDWDGTGDPYQRFTITVGSKLDDLPTGYNFADPEQTADDVAHLGRMRFPTASGICGRVAITTAYASGTVTITPAIAQPWLRKDPTTGTILVDVYDASMTLVASALSLTRVSDTSFTVVHAAMATAVWMTGLGVNWTHYDATPKKTGVHLEWSFNQRALSWVTPPSWYGGIGGCLACSVTQFTYSSGACPAAIGIVPFYSPLADTSGDLPDQNSQPPGNEPVEQFPNQEMFDFPATVIFDDVFGAHWQAAVMLTMPDPFWQQPFKPDCFVVSPDAMLWKEDDGTGQADTEDMTEGGATVYHRFYAHHPLVEALSTIPAGMTLPAGVSLLYDPTVNVIAPPFYSTGIPIADNAGNYSSVEMDWGFTLRVCGNVGGRFRSEYNFVTC